LQIKQAEIDRVWSLLESHRFEGQTLAHLLRRTEIGWLDLVARLPALAGVDNTVAEQVVFDTKYAGYISRQQEQIGRQQRLAAKRIPEHFDYSQLAHLRAEAREKLTRIRPVDLAQASRISGITPADIALLLACVEGKASKSRSRTS
jgi:tRNA uridine 5-carboxymethylaminomethyl modification enzyme